MKQRFLNNKNEKGKSMNSLFQYVSLQMIFFVDWEYHKDLFFMSAGFAFPR
jgi:hypothetical protein